MSNIKKLKMANDFLTQHKKKKTVNLTGHEINTFINTCGVGGFRSKAMSFGYHPFNN